MQPNMVIGIANKKTIEEIMIFFLITFSTYYKFYIYYIIEFLMCKHSMKVNKMNTKILKSISNLLDTNRAFFICLLTAIVAVTICSKCSPLYPFNDWCDSNCFFTVGKSMFKGLVPYRDLYEQKGPLIYYIHGFASLISYKTFIGMYFFEIIGAFFFLLFSYKTLELYCGNKVYHVIPFLAFVVYTSTAFCHGDSAEELCFPFLSYMVLIAFKNIKANYELQNRDFLFIGVIAACVFWTKFSLCGLFLGWYIPFAIDKIIHKRYFSILNSIVFILCGLIIGTLPHFIYFGINNSLEDLFQVYIHDNIFSYSVIPSKNNSFLGITIGLIKNLWFGLINIIYAFPIVILLLFISGIYCMIRNWYKELIYSISIIFAAFFFIYIGGRSYTYYSLGLAPYLCFGFVPVFLILYNENERNHIFSSNSNYIYLILLIFSFGFTKNRYMIGQSKEILPQYKFSEVMSKTPNATLLNFGGLDIGLYTTTGIVPNCKYFCKLNIPSKQMLEEQIKYIENGLCDYIVIVTFTDDANYISFLSADKNHLYSLVCESKYWFEGIEYNYLLYKLSTTE